MFCCREICNNFALPKSFSTSTNRLVIALPDFNTACNSKRSDHGGWLSFCHFCERYTRYFNDLCHNHKRLSVPIATSPHDAIAQLHMYNFHSRSFTRSPTLMRPANTMAYCALRSNSANTLSHTHTSLLTTSCIMTSPNLDSAQRKLAHVMGITNAASSLFYEWLVSTHAMMGQSIFRSLHSLRSNDPFEIMLIISCFTYAWEQFTLFNSTINWSRCFTCSVWTMYTDVCVLCLHVYIFVCSDALTQWALYSVTVMSRVHLPSAFGSRHIA